MIRCTRQYNNKCRKCGDIRYIMINIGAFYMCPRCFADEFNSTLTEFEPDSSHGKVYYKWLEVYKNKGG